MKYMAQRIAVEFARSHIGTYTLNIFLSAGIAYNNIYIRNSKYKMGDILYLYIHTYETKSFRTYKYIAGFRLNW